MPETHSDSRLALSDQLVTGLILISPPNHPQVTASALMPGPAFAILRLHVACSDPGQIEEDHNMVNKISDFKFAVSPEASASVHDENLGTSDGDIQFAGVVANRASTNEEIHEQEESSVNSFPGIVGRSAALRDVLQQIEMVALIRITRIHQNHQISPQFTSFHRFMIGGDSCCRFVFKRLRVGTRFAFKEDACR